MSGWTHAMCSACWNKRHPNKQVRKDDATDPVMCCFCGKDSFSGIYIREAPSKVNCHGEHDPAFDVS